MADKSKGLAKGFSERTILRRQKLIDSAMMCESSKLNGKDYMSVVSALRHKYYDLATIFIHHGCHVRVLFKTESYHTPLYYAVKSGDLDLIKLLLEKGASITDKDRNKKTPLCFAYSKNIFSAVDLILSMYNFNDLDVNDADEISHFYIACSVNNVVAVKNFVKHGMDINRKVDSHARYYAGCTPLHFATSNISLDVVQFLVDSGADVLTQDANGMTPLHVVFLKDFRNREVEMLSGSLDIKANIKKTVGHRNFIDWYPSRMRQIYTIELLLKHNADVNVIDKFGKTPLWYAYESDFRIRVTAQKLLKDSKNRYHKNIADYFTNEMKQRKVAIIGALLDHPSINLNLQKNKEILLSICSGRFGQIANVMLEMLLCRGADVNEINSDGLSLLHLAVKKNKEKLVELLLKYGANSNYAEPYEKLTPLHCAIKTFDKSILSLLISNGASLYAKQENGMTPLHYSVLNSRNQSLYQILLNAGSDCNARDNEGRTALFLSTLRNNFTAMIELLKFGANVNILDNKGETFIGRLYSNRLISVSRNGGDVYQGFFLIEKHIKKLLAAGLHVNELVKMYCYEFYEFFRRRKPDSGYMAEDDEYIKRCRKEVESLKKIKVSGFTSLHDILFKNHHEMSYYVKNETFAGIANSSSLDNQFPQYGNFIRSQFIRGFSRSVFMEPAKESLVFLSGFNLPDLCCNTILKYLDNEHLDSLSRLKCATNKKRKANEIDEIIECRRKSLRIRDQRCK